ncbi:MAG: efflux RND transporter permease subunit [Verrucomicrobia bacterium]|nr:efflux RND transporter permease subunit [Verrucomicrobiota bacterium]
MPSPGSEPTPPAVVDQPGQVASGLTEFSLRRRVTVLVLLLAILVVGGVATLGIPLELFPRGFTGHHLMVFVPWQNAPTQEVLEKITRPLEEELSTVRGLDRLNSYSGVGRCSVFLRFKQGTPMDIAYREVRDRTQRARLLFPDDVDRVFIRKEDASGIPVAVLGLVIDPALIDSYNLIKKEILQPLERLEGVATVRADGLEEKEIIIEVDRQRAEGNGLNLYQLARELGGDNFTLASGHVRDAGKKFLLRSVASYASLEELEQRPITPTVRLKDIARIKYEEPEKRYSVRVNSRPAVAVVILKEGEANTVAVSRRINEAVAEMRADPRLAGLYMESLFNQGDVVLDSLRNLVKGGLIGGVFAGLVLFVFLRRFRLTLIITLAIPISLLIALVVMFFSGESLNILTILALMIAIGMLVDNSIVVAENIHRWHKDGLPRRAACVRGAGEIALAITMATLTTVIVFVPVALVEGQGQFFLQRLALPLSVSLIASLLAALVFIPLSVYLTLPTNGLSHPASAFRRWHERVNAALRRFYALTFERLNHLYNHTLALCLRRRLDLVLVLAAVLALTFAFGYRRLELVEQQEEDLTSFHIEVEASNEYGFEDLRVYFREVEQVLERRQEAYGLRGYFIFFRQRGGEIEGWFDKDRPQKLTAREVAAKLLEELPQRPGLKLYYGRENQAEEAKGKEVFVLRLEGDDAALLDEVAERLEPLILSVEGVLGIRHSEERAPNEMALVIDRDRASASAVSPEVIAGLVGYALRGSALPKYNEAGREIPVRIRFRESDRESLADLHSFQVPTATGAVLPLSAVTDAQMLKTPRGIFRSDKKINRTITIELKADHLRDPRRAGRLIERLQALPRQVTMPEGVRVGSFERQGFNEDVANLKFAAVLSVLFIYLLMGFLFESFILPLSILFTIPLASIGVVWLHRLMGMDVDFLGVVGVILLIGVVVNNGIVLIDYVNRLRGEGFERSQALLRAADRRFRPIAMTALTTIIGMIPLTLSKPNDIGLSYKSFGLTLIGGMSTATLLTLLVVPIFYTFFDDARQAFARALAPKRP